MKELYTLVMLLWAINLTGQDKTCKREEESYTLNTINKCFKEKEKSVVFKSQYFHTRRRKTRFETFKFLKDSVKIEKYKDEKIKINF